MDRRNFLTGLLSMTAAGVAAQFGVHESMGEEIKQELAKDLVGNPVIVGFSDAKVFDNRPVWTSVARMSGFYAEEAAKALKRAVDHDISRAAGLLTKDLDRKLQKAEVTDDQKIIIETPKFLDFWTDLKGRRQCNMHCGVQQKLDVFGKPEIRVGYIAPQDSGIVDVYGKKVA